MRLDDSKFIYGFWLEDWRRSTEGPINCERSGKRHITRNLKELSEASKTGGELASSLWWKSFVSRFTKVHADPHFMSLENLGNLGLKKFGGQSMKAQGTLTLGDPSRLLRLRTTCFLVVQVKNLRELMTAKWTTKLCSLLISDFIFLMILFYL